MSSNKDVFNPFQPTRRRTSTSSHRPPQPLSSSLANNTNVTQDPSFQPALFRQSTAPSSTASPVIPVRAPPLIRRSTPTKAPPLTTPASTHLRSTPVAPFLRSALPPPAPLNPAVSSSFIHPVPHSRPAPPPPSHHNQNPGVEHTNRFFPMIPPQFQTKDCKRMFEVFEFLMLHRPHDFEPYVSACFELYRNHFSRTSKRAIQQQEQQNASRVHINPQQPTSSIPTAVPIVTHGHTVQNNHNPLPANNNQTQSHHIAALAQVQSMPSTQHSYQVTTAVPVADVPPPTVVKPAILPPAPIPTSVPVPDTVTPAAPSQHAIPTASLAAYSEDNLRVTELLGKTNKVGEAVAGEPGVSHSQSQSAGESVMVLDDGSSDENNDKIGQNSNDDECDIRSKVEEIPPSESRLKRSATVNQKVSKRYRTFIETQSKLPEQTNDGKSYIVWRGFKDSRRTQMMEVSLKAASCAEHKGIVESEGNKMPLLFLNILRFLWSSLVVPNMENNCNGNDAGVIFNHGIGFPTHQLILLFAQLYCTTFADETTIKLNGRKKILLIASNPNCDFWHRSGQKFTLPEFKVRLLSDESWYDDVMQWQKTGGVLIISYNDYAGLSKNLSDANRKKEVMFHLCYPGPDMIIIDEAIELTTIDKNTLSYLLRSKTSSRLALTSVSIGGNLQGMHSITSFVAPYLLGSDDINFWNLYMKPITEGNSDRAPLLSGCRAYEVGTVLWRRLKSIMISVDPKERRLALASNGKILFESTAVLNMSKTERHIYKKVSTFLFQAARNKDISCFVALYILSVCTVSVAAMLRLIDTIEEFSLELSSSPSSVAPGTEEDPSSGRSEGAPPPPTINEDGRRKTDSTFYSDMTVDIGKASNCLINLRKTIKPTVENEKIESRKLVALASVVRKHIESNERLVIFVSCAEIHDEVKRILWKMNIEQRQECSNRNGYDNGIVTNRVIFEVNFWNGNECKHRVDELRAFNMCKHGVVLIAPFGIGSQCIEDHGWSYINATKAVVLESSWFVAPLVQALNRVHNFARVGSREVDVLYVEAVGTVDKVVESVISRRYTRLKDAVSRHLSTGRNSRFPVDETAGYRGYFMEPELAPAFLNYDHCLDDESSTAMHAPYIKKDPHPDHINSMTNLRLDYLENLKEELLKMPIDNDDHYMPVEEFNFSVSRYQEYCEVLEMAFSDSVNMISEQDEEKDALKSEDKVFLDAIDRKNKMVFKLTDSGITLEKSLGNDEMDSMFRMTDKKRNGFMELWKHYFIMYECANRRSEDLVSSSQKGGMNIERSDCRSGGSNSTGRGGHIRDVNGNGGRGGEGIGRRDLEIIDLEGPETGRQPHRDFNHNNHNSNPNFDDWKNNNTNSNNNFNNRDNNEWNRGGGESQGPPMDVGVDMDGRRDVIDVDRDVINGGKGYVALDDKKDSGSAGIAWENALDGDGAIDKRGDFRGRPPSPRGNQRSSLSPVRGNRGRPNKSISPPPGGGDAEGRKRRRSTWGGGDGNFGRYVEDGERSGGWPPQQRARRDADDDHRRQHHYESGPPGHRQDEGQFQRRDGGMNKERPPLRPPRYFEN